MYATSPDRYGFMIENYRKRLIDNPDNPEILKTIEFYEKCRIADGQSPPKQYDLEYDLRTCDWIVDKCKSSESYSQNLYAALCNNSFSRDGKEWSCSWRSAGGIVSNLREQGDYVDWYCSGMYIDEDHIRPSLFVSEGHATDEIIADFEKLGWKLVT